MEYREIKEKELNKELFFEFNRYQEVKECLRKVDGTWAAVKNPFTEQWRDEDYEVLIRCLKITINTGGVVFGAFLHGVLKGFASVEGVPLGKERNYLDLSSLHVSYDLRGKKTGRRLFQMASEWARLKGAQKLYISSHSSVETQAFYRAMGCVEAKEYDKEHVSREPYDCQLEYVLERKVVLYIGVSLDGYIKTNGTSGMSRKFKHTGIDSIFAQAVTLPQIYLRNKFRYLIFIKAFRGYFRHQHSQKSLIG